MIPLINGFKDIDKMILSYLERREIEDLAHEQSPYHLQPEVIQASLQFINEDQACLREGFTKELVQIFQKHNLSLWRIPVLNLTERIDEIFIKPKDMQNISAARFKEKNKRPVLAFHLQGYDQASLHYHSKKCHLAMVWTCFSKDRDSPKWSSRQFVIYEGREEGTCFSDAYDTFFPVDDAYNTYFPVDVDKENAKVHDLVTRILSGTYWYSLINEVPQVEINCNKE